MENYKTNIGFSARVQSSTEASLESLNLHGNSQKQQQTSELHDYHSCRQSRFWSSEEKTNKRFKPYVTRNISELMMTSCWQQTLDLEESNESWIRDQLKAFDRVVFEGYSPDSFWDDKLKQESLDWRQAFALRDSGTRSDQNILETKKEKRDEKPREINRQIRLQPISNKSENHEKL